MRAPLKLKPRSSCSTPRKKLPRPALSGLQESKDEAARMRRETEEDLKHRREEVGRLERRITETEGRPP